MSDAAPSVEVLIPVYNHERFVAGCLESVRQLDYRPLRVGIIDDGSSDASARTVEDWLAAHPDLAARATFQSRPNRGLAATLNELVARSSGDLLVLLASDDRLLPDGIAPRVKALQAHPDWLAVFADCQVIGLDGRVLAKSSVAWYGGRPRALASRKLIAAEMMRQWSAAGPGIMLRRAAFDPRLGVGPYDENLQAEDVDLYLRLLARHALGFIPNVVAQYRWQPDALKGQRWKDIAAENHAVRAGHARAFTGLEGLAVRAYWRRDEAYARLRETPPGAGRGRLARLAAW
ncbi:MAG TPA: glycosyltransferase, partial [Deinococcales bacterium]|nr:glycosyltransferase [Deinococcales bacterium]